MWRGDCSFVDLIIFNFSIKRSQKDNSSSICRTVKLFQTTATNFFFHGLTKLKLFPNILWYLFNFSGVYSSKILKNSLWVSAADFWFHTHLHCFSYQASSLQMLLFFKLGSEPTMIYGNPLLCSIHNPQFSPILPILTHWSHELPTLPI